MFITSTTRELSPVVKVDDRVVGAGKPGPITQKLLARYQARARELTRSAVPSALDRLDKSLLVTPHGQSR